MGCDLLKAAVRQQEAQSQSQSSVGVTPIGVEVVTALKLSSRVQSQSRCSPECLRAERGLKPGNADWSFLPEVECGRSARGRVHPPRLEQG
jgi:hypothetical protein